VRVAFISGGRARPIPKPLRIAMKADQAKLGCCASVMFASCVYGLVPTDIVDIA
jgi:hypothetical protein